MAAPFSGLGVERRKLSWWRLSGILVLSGIFWAGTAAAAITVDANTVIRDVPKGAAGACAASKFWETISPPYRSDMLRAKVGVVRIVGFPADSASGPGVLEDLDTKVAQIINAGGTPLFIQCIESESNETFKNALLDLNGNPYGSGSTVPIVTRVSTNIAFLVNRYRQAPYNLALQYWEVGNEPDIAVNYQVASAQEYINFFQAVHLRLVSSGIRQNVILCGPAVSWDYGFGGFRDTIMNAFLPACKDQVDIVTRHVYGLIYSWENIPNTAYNQLNSNTEMLHFDTSIVSSRGEKALINRMNSSLVPATVGTGITEMNLFTDNVQVYNHTIVHGLWFLLADHFSLYNPRSSLITGFQFDRVNNILAYYKNDGSPSYPYWATYMHGVLGGNKVLAQTSTDPSLVVTATKDDSYIYVQVINRNNVDVASSVTLNNASVAGSPMVFRLSGTQTPDVGLPTSLGTSFSSTFAATSAAVYRYQRSDAPQPPAEPAAPTAVLLDTDFLSAPSGMLTYTNNAAAFTPVVTGGNLQMTRTSANLATAAVFSGQPLASSQTRVQVRFGFRVAQNYAEGFVFGAYSGNPGSQGNPGQALGYQGQSQRIWGVKVDNNPDQIAITGATVNGVVDGWVTQPLSNYAAQDMFMVIDYDGAAGAVRARLYQGASDAGLLKADITNKVGNPASLPAGTVFGFTGGTGSFSQDTYIQNLRILTDTYSVPFVTGQTLSSGVQNNYNGWLGFRFTVGGSPLTIVEVGRWVRAGNTGTHTVKLVRASDGVDVPGGAASVNTLGAPAGAFSYAPLAAPVVLSPNTVYYLVSREPSGTDYYHNYRTVLQHTTHATINSSAFGAGNGRWSVYGTAGQSYVPVSFKLQP